MHAQIGLIFGVVAGCLGPGLRDVPAAGPAGTPEHVTFTEHVAPIVFNHCASCHRPGEAAPFPLLNYRDVKKHGHLIRGVVDERTMPPWPPAEGWGHFQDERRLAREQIELIDRWVESGMAEGPAEKLPPLPAFAAGGWTLGTPDLVVTLPEAYPVPADGKDIYRMFVLPLNQKEDRWVTAVEIRPTARSVVHHALYFLDSTGAARKLDEADLGPGFGRMGFPRTGTLGGWAVGATARRLPLGLAFPLAAGSDLVVQMHLHPSGKPEREQTSFGIYFAKEPPRRRLLGTQAPMLFGIGTALRTKGIEPGDRDFTIHGTWKVPFDVDVVGIGGHAHYLCKTMKAVAELPDGKEVKLFAIDDWDFNWQGRYNYVEPVRLPKGAVVRTTLVYDNSAENPRNPSNPPVKVRWGEGSLDEMGSVGLMFVAVNEGDLASYRGPAIFGGGDTVSRLGRRAGPAAAKGLGGVFGGRDPAQVMTLFDALDADQDGKLKGDELPARLRLLMFRLDANHDGILDRAEMEKAIADARGDAAEPGPGTSATPLPVPSTGPTMADLDGRAWNPLRPAEGTKANVLVFLTRDCPVGNTYTSEIGRIANDYSARHVAFLAVYVDPDMTADEAKAHAKEYGLTLPIVRDVDHVLVKQTGAEVVPEAAVIGESGRVAYCGRIDDRFGKLGRQRTEPSRHDLRDALDAVLAGKPVAQARVPAIGCPIADMKK
ncbi:redoxin domain-containing protein [Aquisphaera insulae]|uniref:redoxin domain-containing protein n=1 Tax=Aquisphaera insulae TaxID=2712864 RepID=UPI0013EC0E9A|nr:redoxin domain-containing protein [Aquisphaera insulae]